MNIEEIKIWAVFTTVNESGREGGIVSCWETKSAAENNRKGHGLYGGPGNVRDLSALRLPDGRIFVLLQPEPVMLGVDFIQQRRDARAAALAKLTPEERELLGISHRG